MTQFLGCFDEQHSETRRTGDPWAEEELRDHPVSGWSIGRDAGARAAEPKGVLCDHVDAGDHPAGAGEKRTGIPAEVFQPDDVEREVELERADGLGVLHDDVDCQVGALRELRSRLDSWRRRIAIDRNKRWARGLGVLWRQCRSECDGKEHRRRQGEQQEAASPGSAGRRRMRRGTSVHATFPSRLTTPHASAHFVSSLNVAVESGVRPRAPRRRGRAHGGAPAILAALSWHLACWVMEWFAASAASRPVLAAVPSPPT